MRGIGLRLLYKKDTSDEEDVHVKWWRLRAADGSRQTAEALGETLSLFVGDEEC
jgi:hypothetical protein